MGLTDAANPFIRARLVAQETQRVRELTPEDASSTFAATPPLERLKVMLSRCMKVLGSGTRTQQ